MTAPIAKMQAKTLAATKGMSKAFDSMNSHVDAVNGKLKSVATTVGLIGAGAAAGLVYAGKAGADFEEAIAAVGAVSLASRDQIADLEKEALRLGSTTKFTATEAANAMEVMGRAGFTNAEVLAGVGGILNAAAAEGAEMAEVANHVSNVLKGMGLQASEAGRVADVLALASARTNSSISSLGESMKNLSPVAKQFGIGLEDAVGMVALLQDVGLDASEAGTATATMLTKLSKPADEVAAKMKQMGIAFKDAKGNMLPPLEVFQNMQAAAGKLGGNMDQVAFFADLVGLRGQKAALNLKDLFSGDKGQALTKELRNAAGSAEKMANLRMQNLKGDLTILGSTVEGLQIALYNTESGPLRGVVQGITEWIGKNQELIVSGFTEFMADIRDSMPEIVKWLERVGKVVAVWMAFSFAVKAVNAVLLVTNALAAANPLVLWAYAIVAAVALIWAFWPEIQAFFARLWKGIVDLAKTVGDALANFFSGLWGAIQPFVMGAVRFLIGLVVIIAQPYIQLFKGIAAVAMWAWEQIKAAWSAMLPVMSEIWAAVSDVASAAWGRITGAAKWAYNGIVSVFRPIGEFFSGLWGGIASAFKTAMSWVLEKLQWLIDKGGWLVDLVSDIGGDAMGGDVDLSNDAGADVGTVAPRAQSTDTTTTTRTEVTVKAAPGAQAKQTGGPRRAPGLRLNPTGGFAPAT